MRLNWLQYSDMVVFSNIRQKAISLPARELLFVMYLLVTILLYIVYLIVQLQFYYS